MSRSIEPLLNDIRADLNTYYRGTPKELHLLLNLVEVIRLLNTQVQELRNPKGVPTCFIELLQNAKQLGELLNAYASGKTIDEFDRTAKLLAASIEKCDQWLLGSTQLQLLKQQVKERLPGETSAVLPGEIPLTSTAVPDFTS